MINPSQKVCIASVSMSAHLPDESKLKSQATGDHELTGIHVVRVSPHTSETATETAVSIAIPSKLNLGGAGGFSYAILSGLATNANWIWLFDDDATPIGDDCLSKLLAAAQERELQVVSPLVVSSEDHNRLSFPFRLNGTICYDRAEAEKVPFIRYAAHFFNGALVRRDVFFKVGLPDLRLFLRGDEVDFMLRLKRAKIPYGTVTNVAVAHPSDAGEAVWIIKDRVAIVIPETEFKRYYYFRNRGYLVRRHRRIKGFVADVILTSYAYLFIHKWDIAGWAFWWKAYRDGLTYTFDQAPHLNVNE